MGDKQPKVNRTLAIVGAFCVALSANAEAAIVKKQDRKFPTGQYCPLESRAAAGADLSFVAPAATIRISFSVDNLDAASQWNAFRVDNVAVVDKAIFDANQASDIPGFDNCYDTTPPPGQTTGGIPNAPAYDFDTAGTTEIFLDLFSGGVAGWTGSHFYFDPNSTAPTNPADGTGFTGGSLGLGLEIDGNVEVSASRIIAGLTPGEEYVVSAWWYAIGTSPLTITIGVPCVDQDEDGFVMCGACDLLASESCGECDDTNPNCTSSCIDTDSDGWCVTTDCDDDAATCTADCTTDLDADQVPDCGDGCIDPDEDGYGTAGGGGDTCLGADCDDGNFWCNVSCVDADLDGRCLPWDCQDYDPAVGNELPEVNDCSDQQCAGDEGYGLIDEISGAAGFFIPGNTTDFSWPAQAGATQYLAVRSGSPDFPSGCNSITTSATSWIDVEEPPSGSAFFYRVRSLSDCQGSWGRNSAGAEPAAVCGMEAACGNSLDDDGDMAADCADPDCAGTPDCRAYTFSFVDTSGDDLADDALYDFFDLTPVNTGDFIFFEIVESPSRVVAWCSEEADYYKTQYLNFSSAFGTVTSGVWDKWRKAPSTGDAWVMDTSGHTNTYGFDCFGSYSWCSEQFSSEPQNSIFPDRTNDCEAYDLSTGACGTTTGQTWQLTIRVGPSRLAVCGF